MVNSEQDQYIVKCAAELVKAINDSGRTVLRQDCDDREIAFGHIDIWIHGEKIEVEYLGESSYRLSGEISEVK